MQCCVPSAVLLNANCDLKLCDFGLSRGVTDDHETGSGKFHSLRRVDLS
jgi:serine/threonine protein kinase